MPESPASLSPSPTPRLLVINGRYRIARKLGSGATGAVYLADDTVVGREVALKVLRADGLRDCGVETIQSEFRSISRISHPGIARAFDFGYTADGQRPFYTREHVRGRPLEPGPPAAAAAAAPAEFLSPLLDLLEALHFLHLHDIYHLDIHAGNLIVSESPERGAVLIDIALPLGRVAAPAAAGAGPRSDLAPELLRGDVPGAASDLHAAGRLLLYRLTGSREGRPTLPPQIAGWGTRVTLELERIITKALQDDPSQRFQSALEFRHALLGALGGAERKMPQYEPLDSLVERERELERIERCLEEAREGAAASVCLVGPTGVGKSRLLTEARWRSQLCGLQVAEVRFTPGGLEEQQLVRALRCVDDAREPESSWLSPLERAHGGSSRDRAVRAVDTYFETRGTPLVILADDIEHSDRESRLLLEEFLSRCARGRGPRARGLAVIVTSTDAITPRGKREAGTSGDVRLRPLRGDTARQYLQQLLKPLELDDRTARSWLAVAGRLPLRVRQLAHAAREAYGDGGSVPRGAPIPDRFPLGSAGSSAKQAAPRKMLSEQPTRGDSDAVEVLRTLAVLGRGATRFEVADLTALPRARLGRALRLWEAREVTCSLGASGRATYRLIDPELREEVLATCDPKWVRSVHRRVVERLRSVSDPSIAERESLVRHLLAAGERVEARGLGLEVADVLESDGLLSRAIRLLEDLLVLERSFQARRRIAEKISSLDAQLGDHLEGIAVLEPVVREGEARWSARERVRLLRQLGVHYHRSGHPERALEIFGQAFELARPGRDREALIFLHSEVAEIHIYQGDYERAQEACRAGLSLLEDGRPLAARFRAEMEVTLRASLAHVEMRCLRLERARDEFEAALGLARQHDIRGPQGLILNNLGIVHNHLNDFDRAVRSFEEAERLLAAAGERHARIHIACNLGLIAAKRGDAQRARAEIEKATRLLRAHPGERLEFMLAMARAVTQHHLGRFEDSLRSFDEALPRGRRLGDLYLVRFGEVYRAEALIICGRYREAHRALQAVLRAVGSGGPQIVGRLVASRLLFLGALLGNERIVRAARRALASRPRTEIALLEAWNDLFLHGARRLTPSECRDAAGDAGLEDVLGLADLERFFEGVGIPLGARLSRVLLLADGIELGRSDILRRSLRRLEAEEELDHRLLHTLEHLVAARSADLLGDVDRADQHLQRASGALVGEPLLELDGLVEFERAALADRRGDRQAARHHFHRGVQARDFLVRTLPESWQEGYLRHERFQYLELIEERLDRSLGSAVTPVAESRSEYFGIVGSSPAIQRLVETLRRLRPLELNVLICGPTGSGKDLVARAVHKGSPRGDRPFYGLHCASLPTELFESELFGYEAGAFTGAEEPRTGILEYLRGGTLYLDEITHLSPETQSKLLQVLDRRMVRPVGGLDPRPIDVRFLASTSEKTDEAVREGRLRHELYYRLREVEVVLPSLADRVGDIPLVAEHLSKWHADRLGHLPPRWTPEALRALEAHEWPGNVRELGAFTLRLLVTVSPGALIDERLVRRELGDSRPKEALFSDALLRGRSLNELRASLERAYLTKLFRDEGGDIRSITRVLGIKRSNLYSWFRRVGVNIRELRREL